MKNFKKLFASVASVLMLASMIPTAILGVAAYDADLTAAYDYSLNNGITTKTTIESANMYGTLTRIAMAKMIANYAIEIKGKTPDTTQTCAFSDVSATLDAQYDNGVTKACQLGLMGLTKGVQNKTFNPNGTVTRAMFATILDRIDNGSDGEGTPYYAVHLQNLNDAGIMTDITNPERPLLRGHAMLMMMRSDEGANPETPAICQTPENIFACSIDYNCPAECKSTTPVVQTNGNLTVSLSNDTLVSQKLPKAAEGVPAATFTLKVDEDITLKSVTLKRVGMDAKNGVNDVAIFINGQRASNAKTFNSSSDDVTVYLNPSYTIKADEKVDLVAKVTTLSTQGAEFAIALKSIESTAEDMNADFPIIANQMEIGSVSSTAITLANDGSVADVKVGNKGIDVLRFSVKNDSTENETIKFSSITLKEDGSVDETTELGNFKLYNNGDVIASAEKTNGKYLTFNLDKSLTIGEGKTEKFIVKADILGGASKIINFVLDKDLDVTAESSKYGYVNIAGSVGDIDVDIEAGALTITAVDNTSDEIRKDKNDNVFGILKVATNAGKDLELQKFTTTITSNSGSVLVSSRLENIELYDVTKGNVYDLTCTETTTGTAVCSDTTLNIPLNDGKETIFQIRADTKNVSVENLTYYASIANTSASPNFYVVELGDDRQVTDITPSSITFKTLEGKASAATVNQLTISATKNAVIGSTDIEAIKFNVEAGNSSALTVKEIKIDGYTGGNTAQDVTNAYITQLKLYKGTELIKTKSASSIAAGMTTFDGLNVDIPKNSKQEFTVKVDVINDVTKADETIKFALDTAIDIEDEDREDITSVTNLSVDIASVRTITIKGYGTLTNAVYTSETPLNNTQNVLGNTTSNFVAAFEVTAQNEAIKLKNLAITESGASTLKDAVSEIILYKADKTTEIARKSVSSDSVTFDAINYVVAEGSEKIFVKVVTHKIGKDQAGTATADLVLNFQVTSAEGNDSKKVISSLPAITEVSNTFNVIPVNITAPVVVESMEGKVLGDGASTLIGKIKLVADTTTNTRTDNGSTLKTEAQYLRFKITTLSNVSGTAFTEADVTLKRVNPLNGTLNTITSVKVGGSGTADDALALNNTLSFDLGSGSVFGNNNEIVTDATYEIYATVPVNTATSNAYIELSSVPSTSSGYEPLVFGTDYAPTAGYKAILTDTIKLGQLKYTGN